MMISEQERTKFKIRVAQKIEQAVNLDPLRELCMQQASKLGRFRAEFTGGALKQARVGFAEDCLKAMQGAPHVGLNDVKQLLIADIASVIDVIVWHRLETAHSGYLRLGESYAKMWGAFT